MINRLNAVKPLRRIDLSRASGCNLETIRYYENIGVMPVPPRAANGYRCYDKSHVLRLQFIMRARDLGFSLDEVRDLLVLVDGGKKTCAEVEVLATGHLEQVRARIVDLNRIEKVLSRTVAQCSGDRVPECAVIDALATEFPETKNHTARE
jgi:MerR family transcriptional regulator, mercuric resistance operon regulatory protein